MCDWRRMNSAVGPSAVWDDGTISKLGGDRKRDYGAMRAPREFGTRGELYGGGGQPGIYGLIDDVTDGEFEDALGDARLEQDLSRVNLSSKIAWRRSRRDSWVPAAGDRTTQAAIRRREIISDRAKRGYTSRRISKEIGTLAETVRAIARDIGVEIVADQVASKATRHDSARIARETTSALEGLAMGVELVDLAELDLGEAREWAGSLAGSLRALSRFAKQLTEMTTQ